MDYLKEAVELSRVSRDTGEFPAGAVLVTANGDVYKSDPSLPHYHGEMMVIDKAIEEHGAPLKDVTIYASMQPCLMCAAKMYWSGVKEVQFVIPKSEVHAKYAYEDETDTVNLAKDFFVPIKMTHNPEHLGEALKIYNDWVAKIESK